MTYVINPLREIYKNLVLGPLKDIYITINKTKQKGHVHQN